VLDEVVAGGADAVLITPGLLKQFPRRLRSVGVILRVDGGSSQLRREPAEYRLLYSVEDALRLGADAVACMGFPGTPVESQTLANLATLAAPCQSWNVPLMAEMLPGGFANVEMHTTENIRLAARIGVELGADFIKTEFVGSVDDFKSVTESCYRPVLVLGGAKAKDERAFFTMIRTALDAGAAGVVVGRNVWSHPQPQAVVAALRGMIHQGASVDEALLVVATSVAARSS
jgi:class I fructose-bisphosphate aldolase